MKRCTLGVAFILVAVVVAFIIPIIINELYQVNDGYITVWNGADVLSFYGAVLGSLGTIALGVVAWEQNRRLLKIEENNFLSNSLSKLLISHLCISGFNQNACNLDLHTEQILTSDKENYLDHSKCHSFNLTFTISTVENYPALLKIERIILAVEGKDNRGQTKQIIIDAENIFEEYSMIAMSKDGFVFNCTCIIPSDNLKELQILVQKQSTIIVSVFLRTVTVKCVCTRWRLRAKLLFGGGQEKAQVAFKTESTTPATCFWLDSEIVSRKGIKMKRIDELDWEKSK